MRNYTFTENGFTFKRINKAQAKRAYNNGLTVRFCPVNLRPGSPFRFDMDMNKVQQNCAGVDFEQLVNAFEFYNCGSNETGYARNCRTIYQNDRNPAFPVRVRRCKKWVFYSCWFSRLCCWLRF